MRRLTALGHECGFQNASFRSYGFAETTGGPYMLSVIDRGADTLRGSGFVGEDLAAALKAEARRRAESGLFFGHIAYASLSATKPS
jgi:hypothetical protein